MIFLYVVQPNIDLPNNITIPSDRKFKFILYAHGYQIYKCDAINKTWTLGRRILSRIMSRIMTFT
jgi:hypothetical protein